MQTSQHHHKVQVLPKEIELGTSNLNNMEWDIAYVEVDLSMLPMILLHNIQQAAVEEIKAWEHIVYDHLKQSRTITSFLQIQL